MSDTNDILRKLAAQAGGEAALSALERALSSADGRRAVSSLSASHEALLRAAVRPEKRALLSALRPFVAEDVASQFDRALRLAGMAGMARAALGQLEHRAEGGEHSV